MNRIIGSSDDPQQGPSPPPIGASEEIGGVGIRHACLGDAEEMPRLEQSAGELFRSAPGLAYVADGDNHPVERYRSLIESGWCWIAQGSDGRPVGFLCAERFEQEIHICELAVDLDHQRRGIGRRLLDIPIGAAARDGLDAVTLTTFRDLPWNAPFYDRLGFREIEPDAMGPRLRAILDLEAQAGLPSDRRCAMILALQ